MAELTLEQAGALAPLAAPRQAAERVAAGAVLIDVRSAAGRSSAGALLGAVVVAKDEVDQRFDMTAADHLAVVTDKSTPIVVSCGSVLGSGPVAARLIELGFTDVVQVEGGFPAWKAAGLPVGPPAP